MRCSGGLRGPDILGGCTMSLHHLVSFKSDVSAATAIFEELSSLVDTGDLPPEIGKRLIRLVDAGAELFTFKSEMFVAGGADNLVITAQPSDALAIFMAAARTCNADLSAVEQALRHLESSHAGVSAEANMTSSGAGVEPSPEREGK